MFNLKKVIKSRKRLEIITKILFKLFQLSLRYKEKRPDYGVEIFEYFYLPWKTDREFNNHYKVIHNFTLNPKSRLFTLYDLSKRHLKPNSTYIEVGCWKGGASALVALANQNKKVDFILCDTFSGVKNSSDKDSFFVDGEYSDTSVDDIKELELKINQEFRIVEGNFPSSMNNTNFDKPISFTHVDVDTYISARNSLDFIINNSTQGAVIVLDDYGGWFTDGITKLGNELKSDESLFVVPNHLGQLIIYKL